MFLFESRKMRLPAYLIEKVTGKAVRINTLRDAFFLRPLGMERGGLSIHRCETKPLLAAAYHGNPPKRRWDIRSSTCGLREILKSVAG